MKLINDIINKFGTDKVLHFLSGAVIAFIVYITFILMYRIVDFKALLICLGGLFASAIIGFWKELFDFSIDWSDIKATALGGLVPFVFVLLGIVLYVIG